MYAHTHTHIHIHRFNQILCARSYAHLRAVFADYARISKTDIMGAIKREMSGDLEKAYLAVGKCVCHDV